jgi:hypothetical protein
MLMVGVLIAFISGGADARPLPTPIADCDGSGATYFSSTHSANEDWFSLTGRVVGQDGAPVCGAEVSARYLEPLETKYGSIEGSSSPTGLNGEFFLANLRKGVPFTVSVNPYYRLEVVIGREGVEGLGNALKKERNARVSGVGRYSSEELRHAAPSSVMRFDIALPDDPTATGIVLGEAFWVIRWARAGRQPRASRSQARIRSRFRFRNGPADSSPSACLPASTE